MTFRIEAAQGRGALICSGSRWVPQELRDYDTVVFDPPQAGAQAQATLSPPAARWRPWLRTCSTTSLCAATQNLIDGGYAIGRRSPVDQFRHTPHVELVARFVRKR